MTLVELVRLFAEPLDLAVLVTDCNLERPGPTILYANPAFARMSGYAVSEVLGASPRLLQGAGTNRQAARAVLPRVRAEGRFHGVLENYRRAGETYLCEIDVRPICGADGQPAAFIAFEREVVRRRGRPSQDGAGRYRAIANVALPLPLCAEPTLFA
ncbi:PAS domain S-box-containing protein [Methylobacterium sp. BE186]|uniref:PAS domain-containing protein n=1 Tax=Methylobacterium sp. BE186 TaxID=2817715 RepID=UPI00285F9946|nr:PAS domain-containing protein [Methylobacterium sp. BE186]MDR7037804.1 PAS domain S-box-containing protein [Methylobacterium sp. BE186]